MTFVGICNVISTLIGLTLGGVTGYRLPGGLLIVLVTIATMQAVHFRVLRFQHRGDVAWVPYSALLRPRLIATLGGGIRILGLRSYISTGTSNPKPQEKKRKTECPDDFVCIRDCCNVRRTSELGH